MYSKDLSPKIIIHTYSQTNASSPISMSFNTAILCAHAATPLKRHACASMERQWPQEQRK